jgi:hypothetical protein|tara:strand:+ start:19129 stop:19335 length:207 start_codon:yes stop_codon:yes gene_type:complete
LTNKKKIGIDKEPATTGNATDVSQIDIDLGDDETDTIWVYESDFNSIEIMRNVGADILQKIRAVSGKK